MATPELATGPRLARTHRLTHPTKVGRGVLASTAHTPKILPANTTINPVMLPESLPQDQVVGERTRVFAGGLRHFDHTKNFSERHELSAVR